VFAVPPATTAATATDPRTASAMARETCAGHRRTMCASIVLRRDLHIDVVLAAVDVTVLDAEIGEMDLLIEVRQVMLPGPLFDLARVAIGSPVAIGPVTIVLVEPPLVLALQLVIQSNAVNLGAASVEARALMLVRAIKLSVMLQLALTFETRVEGLSVIAVAIAVGVQEIPAPVGQDHRLLAIPGNADSLDEALIPQMP
jgi:hypothetical protein